MHVQSRVTWRIKKYGYLSALNEDKLVLDTSKNSIGEFGESSNSGRSENILSR